VADVAEQFMSRFRGYSGAHGTYEEEDRDPGTSKVGIKRTAHTRKHPPTVALWSRHLAGQYHLGIIPLTEQNDCWWGAIDIDVYDGLDHMALVRQLASLKVPSVVCRTKSGGAHVYVFFNQPVPAYVAQPKLYEIAAAIGHGGTEVFPKQAERAETGTGNWLNMPYYGGDTTKCWGYSQNGGAMSPEQFLDVAERVSMTLVQFRQLSPQIRVDGWGDSPPCLEHLAGAGLLQGVQNEGLFSYAVLARRKFPGSWQKQLRQWNQEICRPPHPDDRVDAIIKSFENEKKSAGYNYKCRVPPCKTHCNAGLCRTREFGIGAAGGLDLIESIAIVDTKPPICYITLRTGGVVTCTVKELRSPYMFMELVQTQVGKVLFPPKLPDWLDHLRPLYEGAIHIEAASEATPDGRFDDLLEQYCTNLPGVERSDLLTGRPWLSEDEGRMYIRIGDLQKYMRREGFEEFGEQEIGEKLRLLGWAQKQFKVQGRNIKSRWIKSSVFIQPIEPLDLPATEESPV
jgi:TOTE conflict system primase-like protein